MEEKIKSLLLSWDEWGKKEFDVPYIYRIENKNQELVYVGIRHCYDPKDDEFQVIRKQWEEFYERNKMREMIVVVEGGIRSVEETEENAIMTGGEAKFITFLADKQKVSTICFEPSRKEMLGYLEQKYSREMNFYQAMAQMILQWTTIIEKNPHKPKFEQYIEYCIEKEKTVSGWNDFDFSFENLKKIHHSLFNRKFDPSDRRFFYDIINPVQKNTVINEISREEDVVRDTAIVKGIVEEWKKGKSIFVVYGSGHSVVQEPALRELLR